MKRNTNSFRYPGKCASPTEPWWVPRSQRLTREAIRWTRWEQIVGILPPSPRRPLAAPVVEVAELLESVVAQPAVRDDTGARLYVTASEYDFDDAPMAMLHLVAPHKRNMIVDILRTLVQLAE